MSAMQGVEARITGKVYEIKPPVGNGPVVVVVRVSHGKDKTTGAYKPSSWYEVKVFGQRKDEALALAKDQLVQLDVWGGTEEWTGKDGQKRSNKAWYCKDLAALPA